MKILTSVLRPAHSAKQSRRKMSVIGDLAGQAIKHQEILSRHLKTVTITIPMQISNICMFSYTKLINFDSYQLVTIVSEIMLFISIATRF
jgi:hypothetical protein